MFRRARTSWSLYLARPMHDECGHAMIEDVTTLASALRKRVVVADLQFDRLYPLSQRIRSGFHWTPVDVALRACELLAPRPGMRVLDVGSGVGKLCLVGALSTHASWVGIERDAQMIRVAMRAARQLHVEEHVEFLCGDATELDWSSFDAIYLYNPFAEALFSRDVDPMSRRERYVQSIERAQELLAATRPGTRIVTYHGFGGDMPPDADLVHREPARQDQLCVWIRRASSRTPWQTAS